MSPGNRYHDAFWDAPQSPLPNGAYITSPSFDGRMHPPPLNAVQPDQLGIHGAQNGQGYFQPPIPPNVHRQSYIHFLIYSDPRNGNPVTSTRPHHIRHPPSEGDLNNLQARIRNMLSDSDSPDQQTTSPVSPGGRPSRGLYHSPPLHRTYPPNSAIPRNPGSHGRQKSWDSCEDITAYALGIVKSLEIPEDERREKEEFLQDLEKIVERIRPGTGFYISTLMDSGQSGSFWELCKYVHHCKLRYRLLRYRCIFHIRSNTTIRTP